jgi:adenylate cyclase, class 2
MKYEVEQKFRLADPTALEARLAARGAKLAAPVVQVDHYFAHPSRDFASTDEALRIRSVGNENYVTYKGPKVDAVTKTRRELELAIEPDEAGAARFAELLAALGFCSVAEVRKKRRKANITWSGREVEVVLDHVVGLGDFCELELSADEGELDSARRLLADVASELGLADNERRSYLEMLLEKAGIAPPSPPKIERS